MWCPKGSKPKGEGPKQEVTSADFASPTTVVGYQSASNTRRANRLIDLDTCLVAVHALEAKRLMTNTLHECVMAPIDALRMLLRRSALRGSQLRMHFIGRAWAVGPMAMRYDEAVTRNLMPELRLGAPCTRNSLRPTNPESLVILGHFHTGEQRQGALQNDHYGESYSSLRLCQAVTTVNQDNFGGFSHARLTGKFPLLRTFRFIVATRFPDTDEDGPPLRSSVGSTCALVSHPESSARDRRTATESTRSPGRSD